MKKIIALPTLVALVSTALIAGENLLDLGRWTARVERPAVGTIEKVQLPMQVDSVVHAAVRYTSSADSPSAACTRTFHNMVPKRYLFGAWVQINRPDAALSLEVRGADGTVLADVAATTVAEAFGALTPGRWTPLELEADLSDCDASALRTVTFSLVPQWADGAPVIGETTPDIYINDAYLYGYNAALDAYDRAEVTNGSFGMWDGDGVRTPRGWTGKATRCAGAHVTDYGAAIEAGDKLSVKVNNMDRSAYFFSFKARADQETNLTLGNVDFGVVKPGGWQTFGKREYGSGTYTFTGDNAWQLDDVRVTPVYDYDHPRPAERTWVVTASDDDGPGSLREAVENSATGDHIVFDVTEVNLLKPIDLSDRTISIFGNPRIDPNIRHVNINVADGERAFYINPTIEGSVVLLNNVGINGANTSLNGSGMYIGDSRAEGTVSVVMNDVAFHYCKSTVPGGALYVNAPGATVVMRNRTAFRCCEASSGSAVCFAGGKEMIVDYCFFEGCKSTASPGGALYNNHKTAPLTVHNSRFTLCENTASNATSGLAVQYASGQTMVTLCDFEGCQGSVRVYNSTRSSGGETVMSNNTVIFDKTASAITVGGGASYAAPAVSFVNNLMAYNAGNDLEVTRGAMTGTHNYAMKVAGAELANPVADNGKDIFQGISPYNGFPWRNTAGSGRYMINPEGPAHGTGITSFTSQLGKECVVVGPGTYHDENAMCIGSSFDTEYIAGVDDVAADGKPSLHIWPNPACDVVNVEGEFSRVAITNLSGTTVYVGNARTIDVGNLGRGIYIVSAENKGKVTTAKLIVK